MKFLKILKILKFLKILKILKFLWSRLSEDGGTRRWRERFIHNCRYSPSGRSITSDSALTGRSLGPSPSTPRDPRTPRLSILRGLAAISDLRPRPPDARVNGSVEEIIENFEIIEKIDYRKIWEIDYRKMIIENWL